MAQFAGNHARGAGQVDGVSLARKQAHLAEAVDDSRQIGCGQNITAAIQKNNYKSELDKLEKEDLNATK